MGALQHIEYSNYRSHILEVDLPEGIRLLLRMRIITGIAIKVILFQSYNI